MHCLELFSGTHSIGQVLKDKGWTVVSLDRDLGEKSPFNDYVSDTHLKVDIMTWDYKQDYKEGDFDLITASPVCLWWSALRRTWLKRKCKAIHPTEVITEQHIQKHIDDFGKPMVDKVFEIIDYFKPERWWIENPNTSRMKDYIVDHPFHIVDYCKYGMRYQKRTRFWYKGFENFKPKLCKKDCDGIITIDEQKFHPSNLACNEFLKVDGKIIKVNTKALREKYKGQERFDFKSEIPNNTKSLTTTRFERYRIPYNIISGLIESI
jgi:hypothetical protein